MFSSGQCHCAASQGTGTGTGHTQRGLQEWCTLKFRPQGTKDTSRPVVTPGKSPSFCSSVEAFQTWGLSTAPSHCFDLLLCLPAALESPKRPWRCCGSGSGLLLVWIPYPRAKGEAKARVGQQKEAAFHEPRGTEARGDAKSCSRARSPCQLHHKRGAHLPVSHDRPASKTGPKPALVPWPGLPVVVTGGKKPAAAP